MAIGTSWNWTEPWASWLKSTLLSKMFDLLDKHANWLTTVGTHLLDRNVDRAVVSSQGILPAY